MAHCKHPRELLKEIHPSSDMNIAFFFMTYDGKIHNESNWPRGYYYNNEKIFYNCKNNIRATSGYGVCQTNGHWSWTWDPPNCDEHPYFYLITESYLKWFGGIACSLLALIFILLVIQTTRTCWRKGLSCKCHIQKYKTNDETQSTRFNHSSSKKTVSKNLNRLSSLQALYENMEASERSRNRQTENQPNNTVVYDDTKANDALKEKVKSNPSGNTSLAIYEIITKSDGGEATGHSNQLISNSTGRNVKSEYAIIQKSKRQKDQD